MEHQITEPRITATLVPVLSWREGLNDLGAATTRRWREVLKQRLVTGALVSADVLLAFAVWELAYAARAALGLGPLSAATVAAVVPIVAAWVLLRFALGLYPGYGLDRVEELRRHTYSVFIVVGVTAVFAVTFQFGYLLSRSALVAEFMGLLILAPLIQYLVKLTARKMGFRGKPVVVVGSKEAGRKFARLIEENWDLGYNPVAVFDCRMQLAEGTLDGLLGGRAAGGEGSFGETAERLRQWGVDTVIFATPNTRREQLAELVGWAAVCFKHVLVIPNLGGVTNSAVVARNLAGTLGVEIKHNLLDPWALRTKRVLDLAATACGSLLALPLVGLLCLLVLVESGRPVFYSDQRMGRDGKPFRCLKLRTMVLDAEARLQRVLEEDPERREEYRKFHKLRDDPRVTRVGRFLRKTSLDELPQLWNVLRGEMSLVGPRPYLPRESLDIGLAQSEILRVPPGITGPWQVSGRASTSFGERVQMDAYYVRDWSVWLDVVLLARTAKTVLFRHGAY